MLILKAKKDERIFIGDNITLVIVSHDGTGTKIGFEAPQEIQIVREGAKNKQPKGIRHAGIGGAICPTAPVAD